ncbi:hypothetical protein [Kitasatospora sp. A2-31]|uniref:WXG100-like domain-containing protein n=1 Tax=Kitasatospora sp. A2-31 TaxID=2916414 RepID=UPI001EEBF92D|nr:hypothetical protein [Kitasatospora sp. A2-31]MCG6495634.1 hypothetical protein [Kitasatospora sp. A2-31]
MSLQMPPSFDWLAKLTVGQSWPHADEDKLRELGSAWHDAAQELHGIGQQLGASAYGVLDSVGGQVAEEFQAFVTQLESALPEMAESSKQMGDLGKHTALQVEYSKYMILGQLVLLAAQIAQWAFFAPEVLPAAITSARVAVKMILRRLLISVAAGVGLGVGLDAAVQTIQFLKGDRTRWSTENTASAAVSGAIGGAVGGVFFGVGGVVAPRFANSLIGKGVLGAATGITTAGIMLGVYGGEELLGASLAAGAVGALGGGGRRRFGGKDGTARVDPVSVDLPDRPALDLSGVPSDKTAEPVPVPVPVTGGSGPGPSGSRSGTGTGGASAGGRPGSGGAGRDRADGSPPASGSSGRAAAVLPGFATATGDTGRSVARGGAGTVATPGSAPATRGSGAGSGTAGAGAGRQGVAGAARTQAATGAAAGGGAGRSAGAPAGASTGPVRPAEGATPATGHAASGSRTAAAAPGGVGAQAGPGGGAPNPALRTASGGPETRTATPATGVSRSGDHATGEAGGGSGRTAPAVGRPATSSAPVATGSGGGEPRGGAAGAATVRTETGPATAGSAAPKGEPAPRPAAATAVATSGGPEAARPAAAQPRPSGAGASDALPSGPRPTGAGPADARPSDARPSEPNPSEPNPSDPRPPAPRIRLDRTPRFVVRSSFEARRFEFDGPVTDLTVRVAFRDGGRGHDTAGIWERVVRGVEEHFNAPRYELPNGDRLHVTVLPARPGEPAHLTVDLVGRRRAMDQRSWWPDAEPVDYAHEIGHQLGLRDEYRTADLPHRPGVEGSLYGDYRRPAPEGLRQGGLRVRHRGLIGAVVGDLGDPAPAGPHPRTWEEARAAATPHARSHTWVDPVSDPLQLGPGSRPRSSESLLVAPRTYGSQTGPQGSTSHGHTTHGQPSSGGPSPTQGPGTDDTSRNSVIMQPGYSSGDRFGISVALLADPDMHVLIARGPDPGTPGHDAVRDKSREIAAFYASVGIEPRRIHQVPVPSMEKKGLWRALNAEAYRIVREEWRVEKPFDEMFQVKEIWGVTDGTDLVAERFSPQLRERVREAWGLTDADDARIGSWLSGRGINLPATGGKVLVLWSRFTGKATQWSELRSRMEHDTGFQGVRQIVRDLARDYDTVVITGDPHPNAAKAGKWAELVNGLRAELGVDNVHQITGFWRGGGPELTGWGGDTRAGQFRLYDYLHRHHRLDHLGFRSGNLEAVALVGHRVTYLEEVGASGSARMEKWHDTGDGRTALGGTAPGYERVTVSGPPTASGRYAQQYDLDGYDAQGGKYQPPPPDSWWHKPVEVHGQERGFGISDLDSIREQLALPEADRAGEGRAAFHADRVRHLQRRYETLRNGVVTYSGGGPQVEAYLATYDQYFRMPVEQYPAGAEQLYHDLVQYALPGLPQLWTYYRGLVIQAYANAAAAAAQSAPGEVAPRAPQSDGSDRTGPGSPPSAAAAATSGGAGSPTPGAPAGPSSSGAGPSSSGAGGPAPAGRSGGIGAGTAREQYGIPEKNFGKFRRLAHERGLVIDVRPTNTEAPRWLDQGMLPKPKDIKAKTINELDVHLGAKREHVGLVGYFEPELPAREALEPGTWERVEARYRQRAHEFAELAPVLGRLTDEGRFTVRDGLVLGRDGRGEWRGITGDHDVFDITTPGGSRLTPTRYDGVVGEMMANDMAVMHGAHSYWAPQSPFSKGIFDKINASHLPGGEPLVRFRPGAEDAELVHAVERPADGTALDRPTPAGTHHPGERPAVAPAHPGGADRQPTGRTAEGPPAEQPHAPESSVPPGVAPGVPLSAPPSSARGTFPFRAGSGEPDPVQAARVDALAAELAVDVVARAAAGLPLPRVTVTGHANGTVAGQPHFGRAMQLGRARAEAVAELLRHRLGVHLAGSDRALTADRVEITVRSRGQELPEGVDPSRVTEETRRRAVVTVEPPAPAEPPHHVNPPVPSGDSPDAPTSERRTGDAGPGAHASAAGATPAAGIRRDLLSEQDRNALDRAVRHRIDEETISYLFGDGPRTDRAAAGTGRHPSWVDDRALGRWAAGVELEPKYRTLLELNRLSHEGDAPRDRSLLYLGANADVEHPLFTTRATELTLVGVDPVNLNAATRQAHLNEVVGAVVRNLRSYARDGHTVSSTEIDRGRVATVRVEGPDGHPVLTVDYHSLTYDEYLAEHPGERFDVVMDKDSWLLEWRSEDGVADAVAGLLAEGGRWIGGTELTRSAEARFERPGDGVTGPGGTGAGAVWSGYQDLRIRTRAAGPDPSPTAAAGTSSSAASAAPAPAADPRTEILFDAVAKATRTRFQFRDWTFDEAAYTSMLDDDLAVSLPYHAYFGSPDDAQNAAAALALLPGVATRLAAEIATFARTDGDFGPQRVLADLLALLDLDPALLAPPGASSS